MNRKDFFKRLFGTAVVAAVAPSILAEEEDGYTVKRKLYPAGTKSHNGESLIDQIRPLQEDYNRRMMDWQHMPDSITDQDIMMHKLQTRWNGYSLSDMLNELSNGKI